MRILDPGLLTTVQDLGRSGYARFGVGPGGAMDRDALRIGNLLVSNEEGAAGLEMTIGGADIEFQEDTLIALCGADLLPRIAGVPIPHWRAVFVQPGSILSFGDARWGCRAYLAIAGGIDVPKVMGSRSTHLRAALGGLGGRALRGDDDLPIGPIPERARSAMRTASEALGPLPFAISDACFETAEVLYRKGSIRFVRGPHWDLMDATDAGALRTARFTVSTRSDRMGYRLEGPVLRSIREPEMISAAVLTGTLQVPPGGEPIVLMADRQTTGGYPMVAQVISADVPVLAQRRPGDAISFEEIALGSASQELVRRERMIREFRGGMT